MKNSKIMILLIFMMSFLLLSLGCSKGKGKDKGKDKGKVTVKKTPEQMDLEMAKSSALEFVNGLSKIKQKIFSQMFVGNKEKEEYPLLTKKYKNYLKNKPKGIFNNLENMATEKWKIKNGKKNKLGFYTVLALKIESFKKAPDKVSENKLIFKKDKNKMILVNWTEKGKSYRYKSLESPAGILMFVSGVAIKKGQKVGKFFNLKSPKNTISSFFHIIALRQIRHNKMLFTILDSIEKLSQKFLPQKKMKKFLKNKSKRLKIVKKLQKETEKKILSVKIKGNYATVSTQVTNTAFGRLQTQKPIYQVTKVGQKWKISNKGTMCSACKGKKAKCSSCNNSGVIWEFKP